MRGAVLPAALLCAALGLMLAFAPRRVAAPAIALLCVAALLATFVPVDGRMVEVAFLGCWVSIIAMAGLLHLPRGVPGWLALVASANAGAWAGMVLAVEAARSELARALPCVLIVLPAMWVVSRGWPIAVKVVSSWLVAVALLAALLPTVTTPGYVPDHMD